MTKQIVLHSFTEAEEYVQTIYAAADKVALSIVEQSGQRNGIKLLELMKFQQIGFDPLNLERRLNLVEQLNQTFTYLVSFAAAELLFSWHPGLSELQLNLGTSPGSDLKSIEFGGIAAEVFAATSPNSNNKLQKDMAKVRYETAAHKYVFFNCPLVPAGEYSAPNQHEVKLWSLTTS